MRCFPIPSTFLHGIQRRQRSAFRFRSLPALGFPPCAPPLYPRAPSPGAALPPLAASDELLLVCSGEEGAAEGAAGAAALAAAALAAAALAAAASG